MTGYPQSHNPMGEVQMKRWTTVLVVVPADAATKKYKNCKALNSKYPHGVGKKGARDKTSGDPVTNFRVSSAVYDRNKHLDRDKDRIACEKA